MTDRQPDAPQPAETAAPEAAGKAAPWERFGWVMASIWLLFLAFPVIGIVQSDQSVASKALGLSLIATFVVVYIAGFLRLGRFTEPDEPQRIGLQHLTVLAVISVILAWTQGPGTMGVLTFIVSLGMFTLRVKWAISLAVAMMLVTTGWILASGYNELWFFLGIIAMVSIATGLVRIFEEGGARHERLTRERDLVAERERMARDVHDVLGHSLTVISVKAELAERLLDVDPQRARSEIGQISSLSREALAEVRATVSGMRVARLGDELTRARSALDGAGIRCDVPGTIDDVDPRHRIVLAWVLRELVTNVVRHSRATRCEIELAPSGLIVRDDGVGLGEAADGNGLRGLRERIDSAGGALHIGTGMDGRGTSVQILLASAEPTATGSQRAAAGSERAEVGPAEHRAGNQHHQVPQREPATPPSPAKAPHG